MWQREVMMSIKISPKNSNSWQDSATDTSNQRIVQKMKEWRNEWPFMNIWMTAYLYQHRLVWTHKEGDTLKHNVCNDNYSGNFLNVWTCLKTDRHYLYQAPSKIWLPTYAKSWDSCLLATGSEDVVPELWIERRALVPHSCALTIWAIGPDS